MKIVAKALLFALALVLGAASAAADVCLDRVTESWRNVEVDRVTSHGLFRKYGAEAIDDFFGDHTIRQWYWDPIDFYTGTPKRRIRGQRVLGQYYPAARICRAAIIRDTGRPSWEKRLTYLHELGHHISYDYLEGRGRRRHMTVLQKHADFWAGAVAYRIAKHEEGWTAHELFGGRGEYWVDGYDAVEAFDQGWEESKYGDTWFLYYGSWYAEHIPWLWEPSTISLYSSQEEADDARWMGIPCTHAHVVGHLGKNGDKRE